MKNCIVTLILLLLLLLLLLLVCTVLRKIPSNNDHTYNLSKICWDQRSPSTSDTSNISISLKTLSSHL